MNSWNGGSNPSNPGEESFLEIKLNREKDKKNRGGVGNIKGMYEIADLRNVSSNLTQPWKKDLNIR